LAIIHRVSSEINTRASSSSSSRSLLTIPFHILISKIRFTQKQQTRASQCPSSFHQKGKEELTKATTQSTQQS
jgi:hypothetical protein